MLKVMSKCKMIYWLTSINESKRYSRVSEKMHLICKLVIKGVNLNIQTRLCQMIGRLSFIGGPLSVVRLELQKSDFFSLPRATALE